MNPSSATGAAMSESIDEELPPLIKEGSAVWFLPERSYPTWPGKVLQCEGEYAVVESFGDRIEYSDKAIKNLVLFTHESASFVSDGKKKLKYKRDTLGLFLSSINEAVSYLKESDPQFSLPLEDSFDTSFSSTTENTPNTSMDSPQLGVLICKPSTSIRHSPQNGCTSFSRRTGRNRLNASTDSVDTDPLSLSTSFSQKRVSPSLPTQSTKRARQSASPEKQSSLPKRTKMSPLRCGLDHYGTDGDTTAPVDILSQSCDPPSDSKASHTPQSSLEMGQAEGDLSGSRTSLGITDLPSSFTFLPSSTPVAPKSMVCTATPISEPITRETSDSLSHRMPDSSNASSQSTPSSLIPPTASPSASSEDDELPAFNPGAENTSSRKTYIPTINELVWVKFQRHPFWPALVSSITKRRRRKITVNVFFLGDDKIYGPMGIKTLKNIKRYDSRNNRIYLLEAQESSRYKDQILQGAREADQIMQLRLTKEMRGSPWVQFSEIVKRRKPQERMSPTMALPQENQPSSADNMPMTPVTSSSGTCSEDEEEDTMEVQEGGSSPYTFEKLHNYFSSIKLTLQGICSGKEQSDLHDIFYHGKRKELSTLRLLEKFGPAQNMTDSQKSDLLQLLEQLTQPVTGRKNNFAYTYDVLLPEAIARSIAKFEGCSLDAAWRKLDAYQ